MKNKSGRNKSKLKDDDLHKIQKILFEFIFSTIMFIIVGPEFLLLEIYKKIVEHYKRTHKEYVEYEKFLEERLYETFGDKNNKRRKIK